MSAELVPVDYNSLLGLAEQIAKSPLMPAAYRGKPADAAIAMLYGSECGLPPMTSLQRIVVVNGRPGLDAQGMVALIRSRGHHITGEVANDSAEVYGKRGDNGDEMSVTFTIDDAKRAGLVSSGGNYTKYPSDMLWSKAVSRLGRRLFADVLMGFSYTDDEVESFEPQRATATVVDDAPDNTITGLVGPDLNTVRQPPAALRSVESDTGEIIDVAPVPDEANEKIKVIGSMIAESENPTRLRADVVAKFGPASKIPPEDLDLVIAFIAGWPSTLDVVAPDPLDDDGELPF
jgi:hypothetical protein